MSNDTDNRKENRRNIIANLMIFIGLGCIAAAICVAVYYELENRAANQNENKVVEELAKIVTDSNTTDNIKDDTELAGEDSKYYDMPVVEIDGYNYIGYISFETIDNVFPIIENWDYKRLKKAPCRYSGNLRDHNLVIAGHNYRSGFGKLKKMQKGDRIYFTAMNGIMYEFEIELVEVMQPVEIEAMTESPWDLSLYTCTYDGKQRYTVRCSEKGVIMENNK